MTEGKSHPLLTKVLADAQGTPQHTFIDMLVAHVDPAIADRLERALDVCQYVYHHIGNIPADVPCFMTRSAHGKNDHTYQPLVTP